MEIVHPIRRTGDIEQMKATLSGNPRDLLMFTIGINSGLRISDILPLKIGQVRGQTELTIREGKTGKTKTFRFNQAIIDAAAELIPNGAADSDYLFPSRKAGRPISRVQAYRILSGAARDSGVTDSIGCHSLRKTFGYHAYKAGVDLSLLQSIFNHAAQDVTLRYIGITQDKIDDVYAAINL